MGVKSPNKHVLATPFPHTLEELPVTQCYLTIHGEFPSFVLIRTNKTRKKNEFSCLCAVLTAYCAGWYCLAVPLCISISCLPLKLLVLSAEATIFICAVQCLVGTVLSRE